MNASGLARHDIQIVKEYGEPKLITVEKQKALQILVNLVRNAQDACDGLFGREKQIDSSRQQRRWPRSHRGGRQRRRRGPGKPPRIFAHGFTTKKDGHGFGLHMWPALATKWAAR